MGALMHSVADGQSVWRMVMAPSLAGDDPLPTPDLPGSGHGLRRAVDGAQVDALTGRPGACGRDTEFVALLAAYRSTGGLARTHEVVGLLRNDHDRPNTEQLARWIVTRQIISFDWQQQTWFPCFQFDRDTGRPHRVVADIVRALSTTLDDWQIACWFVRPQPWADGAVPAECLLCQPAVVLAAARACGPTGSAPSAA